MTKDEELENYSRLEILRVTQHLPIPIPMFEGVTLYIWPTYTQLMATIDMIERRRKSSYANVIDIFTNSLKEADIPKILATANGEYSMRAMYGPHDNTGLHWFMAVLPKPQVHPIYGKYVAWSTPLRKI